MIATLREDIIPKLLQDIPNQPSDKELKENKSVKLVSGETVTMKLAEQASFIGKKNSMILHYSKIGSNKKRCHVEFPQVRYSEYIQIFYDS